MSTTQSPAPTITNAATKATKPRKLFVNIVVADLQRSINFFEALGFSFNRQFTDATATAMLVGEDAYFMLLTRDKMAQFTTREIGDPTGPTTALYALGVESREAVDVMVNAAIAAGGSHAMPAQDHGFMYGWSFYDLDGHHWEVFWMDPSFVQQEA
jgi:uncharacterized protein